MTKPLIYASLLSGVCISTGAWADEQAAAQSDSNHQPTQELATIVVSAQQGNTSYVHRALNTIAYGTQQISKVPASIKSVGADLIEEQQAHLLADVIKNDAALGEGYAPLGYYSNVVSRGFVLDYGSSYLINGQLLRGEQNIALENKQQVEIIKGITAAQSGLATPGGVVNYVTKRAANVRSLTLAVDQEGDQRVAMDVGGFVGEQQQLGYRMNMAHQNIRPYVKHADGDRQFGSLALDWEINDRSKLLFDIEAQRQQQRSVPGYQLLDGKVPTGVTSDRLLGYFGDYLPVTMRSINSQLHYQYQFNQAWSGALIASTSRVKNNDNSAFVFGCYSEICQSSSGIFGFDKNGNYDIYNYQIPEDNYKTDQFKASLNGTFATGTLQHQLMMELAQANKKRERYEGVNQLIGTGNIYTDKVNITQPLNMDSHKNFYKALDSKLNSISLLDRIEFNPQWTTILGGKWVSLNEKAYNTHGTLSRHTDIDKFLPQVAVMFNPLEHTQLYASYHQGLSDGLMAPWYSSNALEILAPVESTQYEIGLKHQIEDYLFSAALFKIEKDHQGPRPITPLPDGTATVFVAQGQQQNYGLELGLDGRISDALKLNSSLAYTHARLKNTGVASVEGHQVQNVPSVRFSSYANYDIASIEGLSVLGGVRYSSSKYAHRNGIAKVSGFTVVDLGAAYQFKWASYDSTLRLNVDNVFNQKYWRDAGGYLGDDYLFLGAPRQAKLAMSIHF